MLTLHCICLVPLLGSSSLIASPCNSCQLGKSHRLPFFLKETRALKFLYIVHCDVWGSAPTSALDNFYFYLILVDDYSRFCWYYPLIRKSDIASIFSGFISMVENLCNAKSKYLQSGTGVKFIGKGLQVLFAKLEIIHRLSCLGTPEQNGLAECKHRHTVETGLTLLAHSHLDS